jgi:hypothetical protein
MFPFFSQEQHSAGLTFPFGARENKPFLPPNLAVSDHQVIRQLGGSVFFFTTMFQLFGRKKTEASNALNLSRRATLDLDEKDEGKKEAEGMGDKPPVQAGKEEGRVDDEKAGIESSDEFEVMKPKVEEVSYNC